jgi:hypothetical protein
MMVKELFASDINRRIEEVIKVDQTDKQIIRDEIGEYVATTSIKKHFIEILERYWETPNKPHEGVGVWISGFFGSGKSSFAKLLGLAVENQDVLGSGAAELLGNRIGDTRLHVLLKNIAEKISTDSVIFDVSTDRGIRTGNQTLTEIMYRLFLKHFGYASDLDLAELEITLEADGRLEKFKQAYAKQSGKDWDKEKGKIALAIGEASAVMHILEPKTYPSADSWVRSAKNRADITPGLLAERCKDLVQRRHPGKSLVFVIDEVGQFVARDVQKMLDLQAIVQSLGRVGRGKMWIVVTSQEKLTELVGGLDDRRVELARLMDRFPLQVHLEPSDISEVTSKRVLSKNAKAEKSLRELFDKDRARLSDNTRLTADIKLPDLSTDSFVQLYPLLPYQIDLIIQVVSGLRTQGGATSHVGGANRTIIKLAQQLLIHPDVNLGNQAVGALARIDQIYDLVSGNIASEIRGKIDDIRSKVPHPLAQPVAKAICLLQFVRSIHRTPENIAACLHPAIDADSRLPQVKEALEALAKAHMVRLGDDGYRIPTPAEDDWERQRAGLSPKPGDVNRIHAELVRELWQPQPSHNFLDTKVFKAGLFFNGKLEIESDVPFHATFAEAGKEYDEIEQEFRKRSQTETKSIFWAAALDEKIDQYTVEVFRSREILTRKERGAQTKAESALVAEEKTRLRRNQDELRRLLKQSLLSGSIYFRGNDRSPDESATEVGKTAEDVLAQALPEVFDRFQEAAAKVRKEDLVSLLTTENLHGLSQLYTDLGLVKDQQGKVVFNTDCGPLAEILARIANRTSYGETATGRYLTDEFSKEPFGWDFDVVRIFVTCLLRAGKIEATSQGQTLESALSLEAKNTFLNNNLFRQASFHPKVGPDFTDLVEAADAFKDVFGKEVPQIEQTTIANSIRGEIGKHEEELQTVYNGLVTNQLPGADMLKESLDGMRAIRSGNEEQSIHIFRSSYKKHKDAIKRASEISNQLDDTKLHTLKRAQVALQQIWPFLKEESDLGEPVRLAAGKLQDLVEKETFFKELPAIDQHTKSLEAEFKTRHDATGKARSENYTQALKQLRATPGWSQLNPAQQEQVEQPIASRCVADTKASIPLMRADVDACQSRLQKAIEEMLRIVDGTRLVQVSASKFFSGGIETEEQLNGALDGLREECLHHIGSGKKVLIQ